MEGSDKKKEIEAYLNSGRSYKDNCQFQRAIENLQEAFKLAEELKDERKVNEVNLELGDAYGFNSQIEPAIEYFEKALQNARKRADKQQETDALLGLGLVKYDMNNQIETAIEHFQKALIIAREQPEDRQRETRACIGLGDTYRLNNQIHKAIQHYEKALKIANDRGDKQQEINAYIALGNATYRLKNQTQGAIEYFKKALEIAKERKDKHGERRAYLGLGNAHILNSQIQTAIQYYEQALKSAKVQGDKQGESEALLRLGSAYETNSENQTAIRHYEEALEIANERGYKLLKNLARKAIEQQSRITDLDTDHDNSKDLQTSNTSDSAQVHDTADNEEREDIESENTSEETRLSAEQLLIQGRSYQKEGKTEEATSSYEEAFKIADEKHRDDMKAKAYQHLGNLFTEIFEYKKAIEYYRKAREIYPELEEDELEVEAHQWLGDNYLQAGMYKESIEYYKEAVKHASQLEDKNQKINANLGLVKAHMKLGHVNSESGLLDAAVTSYLEAQEIAADLGQIKEEASACLMLGKTFEELKQEDKAIEFYYKALVINKELKDEETQVTAEERLGILCLKLASDCSEDCDYEGAVKWYEKMLNVFGTESNNQLLRKKALTGLGVAWFHLGYTEKAIDSIQGAQKFSKKETSKDSVDGEDVKIPQEYKSLVAERVSSSPIPAEWLKSFEETCNPTNTEWLPNEDLASLEKHIEEFSASIVYTLPPSSEEPLTEKVRKSMTANVKSSACKTLLSRNRDKFGKNDGKFVDDDQQILDIARDDLSKNAATKIPARLLETLSTYMKSVGQISCGKIRGTCFLVTDKFVITNHHVVSMINAERIEVRDHSLPIIVSFDYFYAQQREHVVTVEVDEEHDPQCGNPNLDYKFLCLKENEGLKGRVPLGEMVRSRPLQDGLVIILGHPEGNEMHEETCVVVASHSWREKLAQRHEKIQPSQRDDGVSVSLHMTNDDLLRKYQDRLPYDTSLFHGSSGSPVFDVNGNIVAMHTQGYTLDVEGRRCCSLMEFGVQFSAICEDLRKLNVVEQLFPNYKLGIDEQRMDED